MATCIKCGNEINKVLLDRFSNEGDDYWYCAPIEDAVENAVLIETDSNWCGYGLTEDEYSMNIKCPICGEFPFANREVQVYEVVRLVCFKEEAENANQA